MDILYLYTLIQYSNSSSIMELLFNNIPDQ